MRLSHCMIKVQNQLEMIAMTQKMTPLTGVARYSPKPIQEYDKVLAGKVYGPSTSKLLDTTEAWNLAFLSHDFESDFQHKDPLFTTHVRRTAQTRLDGTGLGIGQDPATLVGSLLTLPAPRFVYLISQNEKLLESLPLYAAYGDAWLKIIAARDRLCDFDDPVIESNCVNHQVLLVDSEVIASNLMMKLRSRW